MWGLPKREGVREERSGQPFMIYSQGRQAISTCCPARASAPALAATAAMESPPPAAAYLRAEQVSSMNAHGRP